MGEFYFRIPTYDELSLAQKKAIEDENAIALSGGPGTGKSVVSLYRHLINHTKETKIKSQLLTFTTTLALYLQKCVENGDKSAAIFVSSAYSWLHNHKAKRDEIIVDEAQDLPKWFHQKLMVYCDKYSYGADNKQLLVPEGISTEGHYNIEKCSSEDSLIELLPMNSKHELTQNYRNSRRILLFAKLAFTEAYIPHEFIERCKHDGLFPRIIIHGDISSLKDTVLTILKTLKQNEDANTAILVPFAKINSRINESATAEFYHKLINESDLELDFSIYTSEMKGCKEIKNVHITTFKSAKGLEFDNVIIPDFHLIYEAFRVVSWRDFYVGVTRARSRLFLLTPNDIPNFYSDGPNKIVDKVFLQ